MKNVAEFRTKYQNRDQFHVYASTVFAVVVQLRSPGAHTSVVSVVNILLATTSSVRSGSTRMTVGWHMCMQACVVSCCWTQLLRGTGVFAGTNQSIVTLDVRPASIVKDGRK